MLRECIYGECANEQHVRRTLTLTHTITAVEMSYVCAYNIENVQLDKSRAEKEFTLLWLIFDRLKYTRFAQYSWRASI